MVGELWFGVERSVTRELNRDRLIRGLARIPKWPFEDEAAQHFGRIYHELRRVSRVMSVVDMQLAAITFALGNCTVVTKDGDLSFPRLKHVGFPVQARSLSSSRACLVKARARWFRAAFTSAWARWPHALHTNSDWLLRLDFEQ